MNTINNHMQYLQKSHILFNIIKHQCTISKYDFSTRNFKFYIPSHFKTIRHSSNTSQISLSNTMKNNDILLTSIKTANKTNDVLEMLRLHNSVMTAPQYLQAINSIFVLQKNKKTTLSNEELTRSPEFTALCRKIQNYSRNLDLTEIVNSVKCLSYLGVSVNSNIMQMLLQLISKMINDMSLQQITFLQFLLKDLSSCPLVDALKLALPIVFEAQVQYKIEENLFWQVEFLNYITKHKLSQESFDFIMSRIIKNNEQLNYKTSKSLLLCLLHKQFSTEKYINVMNECLQMYISNLDFTVKIGEIEVILYRMINKCLNESDIFYNEQFINSIAKHLIKNQESIDNTGIIIKKFNKIGFVHRGLLDYMTNQLTSNHEKLENMKIGILITYIAGCANANYIPPNFIELKPKILKKLNSQKDVLELPWLVITYDLAVLDCWSKELLNQVFSRDFLYGFLKRSDNIHDYVMLLKLYQATITLYPGGYEGSLPPKDIIEKAIELYQRNVQDFPLKAALEHGLGGSDYVLTGIRSKLGHFIDHLVVMRPGGYPVAIKNDMNNEKCKLLENIVESSDNLVIGIMLHKPNNYVMNLNCLRGTTSLTNKTIEALGITLLPISKTTWDGLLDHEKIPYIMRELKSKASLLDKTENVIVH